MQRQWSVQWTMPKCPHISASQAQIEAQTNARRKRSQRTRMKRANEKKIWLLFMKVHSLCSRWQIPLKWLNLLNRLLWCSQIFTDNVMPVYVLADFIFSFVAPVAVRRTFFSLLHSLPLVFLWMLSDKDTNKLQFPVGFFFANELCKIWNGWLSLFFSVWRLGTDTGKEKKKTRTWKTEQIQWVW